MVFPETSKNPAEKLAVYYNEFLRLKLQNMTITSSAIGRNKNKSSISKLTGGARVQSRDRRIRLPVGCSETMFKLNKALGHRSVGTTVEWLLNQSRSAVEAVIGPIDDPGFELPPPQQPAPQPPAPIAGPIMPYPTWVPPPFGGNYAGFNGFQLSASIDHAGGNENGRIDQSGGGGATDVEISADEVAKFLFAPTE